MWHNPLKLALNPLREEIFIKAIININGELFSPENAKISIFDRGFLYGDSIYEVTLVQDGIPIKIQEHFDRLWHSSDKLDMPLLYNREQLSAEIQKAVKALQSRRVYIRLIITRGEGEIGLDPSLAPKNNLIIIAKELPEYPKAWYQQGVHVIIAGVIRNAKESIDPAIKSGNYLNNVMAMTEAKKQGAFDAIMLNAQGNITEATTSNVWIVNQSGLVTPPLKAGILGGITRKTLFEVASAHKIPLEERDIGPQELLEAKECFLSSSTREIIPVVKVNDQLIGSGLPGELTQKLHGLYKSHIHDYLEQHKSKPS